MKETLLRVNNVTKLYTHKTQPIHALKGVTFDLYKGEIFGLLGVNGAGKTTLSSILATLIPPTSGDITSDGTSIYTKVQDYRFKLGFCPQKPNFESSLTVEENLIFSGRYYLMPKEEIKKRVDTLLQQFNLAQYRNASPKILSGGYKQRLLIARSLIHHPSLVILDEPTVGLDPHIRRQLWDTIKSLKNEGVSVILTTHYLDEAEYLSDRVCILDQGVIKVVDTPHNLKKLYNTTTLEELFIQFIDQQPRENESNKQGKS